MKEPDKLEAVLDRDLSKCKLVYNGQDIGKFTSGVSINFDTKNRMPVAVVTIALDTVEIDQNGEVVFNALFKDADVAKSIYESLKGHFEKLNETPPEGDAN